MTRHVVSTREWCEPIEPDRSALAVATVLRTSPVALLWAAAADREVQADAA